MILSWAAYSSSCSAATRYNRLYRPPRLPKSGDTCTATVHCTQVLLLLLLVVAVVVVVFATAAAATVVVVVVVVVPWL